MANVFVYRSRTFFQFAVTGGVAVNSNKWCSTLAQMINYSLSIQRSAWPRPFLIQNEDKLILTGIFFCTLNVNKVQNCIKKDQNRACLSKIVPIP